MKVKRFLRALVILIILISNVSCDQISKNIIRQRVSENQRISVIDSYLTITKIENTGAFLSLGDKLPRPISLILLIILPLIVIGFSIIYVLTRTNLSNSKILGICFILGGGIGNIYDRIYFGSVTDFLHIDFIIFQTGIFNLADVSIMTGMFILIVESIFNSSNLKYKTYDN
jgi:signal peptidase II